MMRKDNGCIVSFKFITAFLYNLSSSINYSGRLSGLLTTSHLDFTDHQAHIDNILITKRYFHDYLTESLTMTPQMLV